MLIFIIHLCKFVLHVALLLLDLVLSHFKALFTAVNVYLIGLHYAIWEFYIDCGENLKFVPKNKLFQSKLKEWRKNSRLLRTYIDEATNEGNQDNKLIAVLTGGEGTIGSEIVDYLLSLEFFVYVIGLNPPIIVSNERIQFVRCDLSARNEVFEAVESITLSAQHIDLLILNAAMMLYPNSCFGWLPFRRDLFGETIIEPHLAINVLANAQLFAAFSQRLAMSKCSSPCAIFLSSCTARAGNISLLLKDEQSFWCRHLNGYKAYADSKLLLSTYVKYLSRVLKHRQSNIVVASVHPGIVPGKLYKNVFAPVRLFINIILRPFLRSPTLAATRVLDVAFSNLPHDGSYYENGIVTNLRGFEDPEYVWLVGTSVRDMIIDSNDNSFALVEEDHIE